MRLPVAAAVMLSAGCTGTPYTLDGWARLGGPPNRAGLAVGCVDVALSLAGAQPLPASNVVVRLLLGNRCDRPVPLALHLLDVRGRYADGRERVLTLVRSFPMSGNSRWPAPPPLAAHELRAVPAAFESPHTAEAPTTVCVNLSGVAPDSHAVPLRCMQVPTRYQIGRGG